MEQEKEKETSQTTAEEGAGEESGAAPKKKKKLIIIIAAVAVVLITVPAVLYFAGVFSSHDKSEKTENADKGDAKEGKDTKDGKKEANSLTPPVTMPLEEFLVNLNVAGKQSRFLKLVVELELKSDADKVALQPYIPRIRDSFQVYLRELRPEDLSGSAAIYRLKEELMLRLVKVVYPIEVNDILFKDIIIQ